MRYDMGPEVWVSPGRVATIWDNGHLCEYAPGGAGGDPWILKGWIPSEKAWRWGQPPAPIQSRWGQLYGWPEGALDAAGPWSVRPGERRWTAEISGPGPALPDARWIPFDPVARRWSDDEAELHPPLESLSGHARLCPSPHGVVLVDPDRALVWSLDDGLAWRLEGVNEEWGLQALRLEGAILIHAACQQRTGLLVRLYDDGRVEQLGAPYGFVCPLRLRRGLVHAPLPIEGVLADGPSGHGLFVFPPDATRFSPPITVLDYGPWASEISGDRWVVNNGHRALILREADGRWIEEQVLTPPKGDPTRLHGPTRLVPQPTARWRGPAGAFSLDLRLENEGQDKVGVLLRVTGAGAELRLARLGEQEARFVDGVARFDHAPLRHRAPLHLTLEGEVSAPCALTISVGSTTYAPVDPQNPRHDLAHSRVGALRAELSLEAGLCLRRDEERLPFDPTWAADLGAARLLDGSLKEPDLERWWSRAQRRCGAESRTPEVEATWARMSRREREAQSSTGVAAYKLRSGQRWVVGEDEARRVASALGLGHPLGAFAAAGPFEVIDA